MSEAHGLAYESVGDGRAGLEVGGAKGTAWRNTMTRQQLAPPLVAGSMALAWAILAGCGRQAPNGSAPDPEGQGNVTNSVSAPRRSPPLKEPAPETPARTPDKAPSPPAQALT